MKYNQMFESLRSDALKSSKNRRGQVEIIADILSAARDGALKTQIVYKANLNFARVKSYLDYLEEKGLLENSGPIYTLTERGKKFLLDYQTMKETLLT